MQLIWLTDIHLNFLNKEKRMDFYSKIIETEGDSIVISGDIAEAPSVCEILTEMLKVTNKPIYFILGNHDYYHSSVEVVRQSMMNLMKDKPMLRWLPGLSAQNLGNKVILIGSDGWADGRHGDYVNSKVAVIDSKIISDLFISGFAGKYSLLDKMQELADADAKKLKDDIISSIIKYQPKKVIILTHIPPFKEACIHRGNITNDEFLPFFASKATGDVLEEIAKDNPNIEFLVLCGHTHSKAHYQPFDNLTIRAGTAEYHIPEIQDIIEV